MPGRRVGEARWAPGHPVIHAYFGIDLEIVWDIVENKVAILGGKDRSTSPRVAPSPRGGRGRSGWRSVPGPRAVPPPSTRRGRRNLAAASESARRPPLYFAVGPVPRGRTALLTICGPPAKPPAAQEAAEAAEAARPRPAVDFRLPHGPPLPRLESRPEATIPDGLAILPVRRRPRPARPPRSRNPRRRPEPPACIFPPTFPGGACTYGR